MQMNGAQFVPTPSQITQFWPTLQVLVPEHRA
jgi:hypothetical protein